MPAAAAAFHQKKNPRILPPRCFRRASSWSMIPPDVVSTRNLYIQHTSIYNLLLHRYTLHDNFTAGMYTTRPQQMPIGVTSTDPSYLPKFTEGNKLLPEYGSVAEWLACWTQTQKGLGSNYNSLTQTVHTHRTCVHQAAKPVATLLRVVWVTAGLAESNGSLPPGL